MKVLYWNLNGKHLEETVAMLAAEHRPEIIILSESDLSEHTLLERMNRGLELKYSFMERGREIDQQLISIYDPACFQKVRDERHVSAWTLRTLDAPEILVFALHLPSKRWHSREDQYLLAAKWRQMIETTEEQCRHRRSLVVGDLNMDPFEYGIIGSEGLHAIMSKTIASKVSRTVMGENRFFFYNPMWRHFGDRIGAPLGTYYHDRSGTPINYYWHLFDQVLVRPELLDRFQDESLAILHQAGQGSLMDKKGIPDRINASDHLPIIFRLTNPAGGH
jgi:exonuclease III